MTVQPPVTSPLLDHCPQALPSRAYLDADWYRREQAAIWSRNWVLAGRRDAFAAGTLTRRQIAGVEVVLVCDAEGVLRAFHNTCRHRGSALCLADRQDFNGRLIRCPYHAWAYDARGKLVSTGHAAPTADFVSAEHGLFPVALQKWNGFVFCCLADSPPDLQPDLGLRALDNWPMDALVVGHSLEKDLVCNWKIFWENYNECLHCPGIHPELSDLVPVYSDGVMSPPERQDWTPGTPEVAALKDGARSWTVTGRACGPEFPDLTPQERATAHTFVTVYPSMFVVAHVDYVRAVMVTSLGPELTRLRVEWLFLPETLNQADFDLASVTDFASRVLDQDGAACEMNQRGLRSPKFTVGRLMPQEFDVYNFQTWVLRQLDGG